MKPTLKNIPYSLLELDFVSKGSTPAETFKNSLKLAQKAEEFGYTRFWLAEHHNTISIASSATSVLIGHIAGGTKTIRVGSGGIMLPNHSPLIVAEQFGTLGALYPNRIDLGLGRAPGTDPATAQAIRADRMQATYQFPEEVSKIQQYFSKENSVSKIRASVAEGIDVPIYILGSSTDSAYLAAKKGLPYAFASHFSTAQLFNAIAIYKANFQPSKFLKEPYIIAGINVIVADTDEEAEKMSTSLIRMILNLLIGKSDYLQEPTEMTAELRELQENQSVQQMLKYTFAGSKETVRQKTETFLTKTEANELMVVTNVYDPEARIKSYKIFSEIMKGL